ncbi:hypothetical protein [Alteromonas halophila]|uniref:hypothetical protein n=1 Tax=Alteromonas halophila TaxID=516698 RepID=UPI0016729E6A|nr:hypothetical protein [Alteromonas halophila]
MFRSRVALPTGAGENWSFENDSKIGTQLSYAPSDTFSATIQALAELNSDDTYSPSIEWAYLTYRPRENLKFRLGRTVFPTFTASDYSNVDFAFLPVRMPHDVYSLVPFPGLDGIDVIFNTDAGKTYLTIQALAGQRDFNIYNNGIERTAYELKDSYGLRFSWRSGEWSGGAGYLQGTMRVDAPDVLALADALSSVAGTYPEFGVLADEISNVGKLIIRSVDVHYTGYRFSFSAEYVQRRWNINMNVSDTDAYYILGGYNFGKWTPYAFYSDSQNKSELPLSGYPAAGPLAPLTATLTSLFGPIATDGSTRCIGLRYDILENLAIKTQFERIEPGGSLYLQKNGQPVPQHINLYSVALSFVY